MGCVGRCDAQVVELTAPRGMWLALWEEPDERMSDGPAILSNRPFGRPLLLSFVAKVGTTTVSSDRGTLRPGTVPGRKLTPRVVLVTAPEQVLTVTCLDLEIGI